MRAAIFLGGRPPPASARESVAGARIYAADAGAVAADAWDLRPDVVVGDMDSVPAPLLDRLERAGSRVVRHPAAKLHTDGRLALDLALSEGATEICFVGATGGRLDHALANLQLLRRAAEALDARAPAAPVASLEAEAELWAVSPARPFSAAFDKGVLFSVLPLTERCDGVVVDGALWPLADATMDAADPYGVSNVATGGDVRVACARGVLAVVRPRA